MAFVDDRSHRSAFVEIHFRLSELVHLSIVRLRRRTVAQRSERVEIFFVAERFDRFRVDRLAEPAAEVGAEQSEERLVDDDAEQNDFAVRRFSLVENEKSRQSFLGRSDEHHHQRCQSSREFIWFINVALRAISVCLDVNRHARCKSSETSSFDG